MKWPNFFIIGAPKCGTTSLARWLGQHPEVFMSPVKEPHYFSTDFSYHGYDNQDHYLSLFVGAGTNHKAVGEASASYLRSRKAVPRIEASISGARYIVMLRNPVKMAASLHWQFLFDGDEDIINFAEAWALGGDRERGKKIPARCRDPKIVQYRRWCRLGEQLSRLYERVERDRVLTIFLEDVQVDVRREWARVLEFLGLSYWDDLEFHPENRAKKWRWPWIRDLDRLCRDILKRFNMPPLRLGIVEKVKRIAVQEARYEPLSPELLGELINTFSDDIDLLAELTGRDLSHWKK